MSHYTTLSSSVTGYRKACEGKPCEDACKVIRVGDATLMAVADGHGDRRCLFAHIGSDIAVRAACEVLKKYYKSCEGDPARFWNSHRDGIAQELVQAFTHGVIDDYRTRASERLSRASADELHAMVNDAYKTEKEILSPEQIRERYRHRQLLEGHLSQIVYLYGTTIRASILTSDYVFNLALGDGDTVAVMGDRVEWLLPAATAYECETASLSEDMKLVIDAFVFSYIEIGCPTGTVTDLRQPLTMLSLSTDGLRNSFPGDALFCEKLRGISVALHERNRRNTSRAVKHLFEKLTMESVFQDDITAILATEA